ncbi:MAG TPA: ATP-binding protein [Verrucomicrobiae bacterium]|nr:ATP-binding protein [Verrucomicrobiae bacterium]
MSTGSSSKEPGKSPSGSPASLLNECLACGVLVVGVQGRRRAVIACTAEAAAHLQTPAAQLRNLPLDSLPVPLPEWIRTADRTGRPLMNREIIVQTPRGAVLLRASILPVKKRTQSQVVVVLNNFSSAPVFEQNIRRLDRLAGLGTLSAGMAHEIKNGLVAVKTFVDLLAQKNPDAELTAIVGHELQRINLLLTQMLRFVAPRPEAFAVISVHELLDHSLRLLQHQFGAKMISLQKSYQARPDTVRGDEAQLQQVFMNLLLNALEAMGVNGVLSVSTETVPGEGGAPLLKIHFRDSGVGITPENLARLFEPFFTTKKNGTGLGLAISRRIAGEHRGVIDVRSEPGKGSTFTLTLPVEETARPSAVSELTAQTAAPASPPGRSLSAR